MKVITWGTRGSMPVSSPDKVRYGGNTTCVQIQSGCIPPDMVLALDAGTGIVPLSAKYIRSRPRLAILNTHWHKDHIIGLDGMPHAHLEHAQVHLYGPEENGFGPKEVLQWAFEKPTFPRVLAEIAHRMKTRTLGNPSGQVIVVHPKAGIHLLSMSRYLWTINTGRQLQLGDRQYEASECMIVTMYKTAHPDFAISYRVLERPSGSVFVFVTDHEKLADHPKDLVEHVRGADVLIQDGQYTEEMYATRTAGWGHGTPRYCVDLAVRAEVKKLYLTHHDPMATDADIDRNVEDARWYAKTAIESWSLKSIEAAYDYMEIYF